MITTALSGNVWAPADESLMSSCEGLDVRRCPLPSGLDPAVAAERFRTSVMDELSASRPDAVVITMSPFWLTRLVAGIQQLGSRVILDLRDPWALDSWPGYRSWWDWRREFRRMHDSLTAADGFVMNTSDALSAVLEIWPDLESKPHEVVPNGWLRSDFPPRDDDRGSAARGDDSPFRIVHSGTLHQDGSDDRSGLRTWLKNRLRYEPQRLDRSGRGPNHLLDAVIDLRGSGFDIEVELVGSSSRSVEAAVAARGCGDFVRMTGYLPHDVAVDRIRGADALFLPLGGLQPGERSLIVPGKTYEYLVAGPPVVAALPDGDGRDLAERSSRAFLCQPCDPAGIAEAIRGAMDWWRRDPDERDLGIEPFMEEYERGVLADRMRGFLGRVVGGAS